MLQEKVRVRDKPAAVLQVRPGYGGDAHRKALLSVLERAAQDNHFMAQLTHHGHEALQSYNLSWQARAALLSGDISWIEARLGTLNARLRAWLDCRLEQEKW